MSTPIVPVMKENSDVRICGDCKTTVNRATCTDSYPLPRIDVLLASLAGASIF
uniref:Uncharacterized protein n=1 Tax=Amphimedon queenslandica TaxID=400682 RepID=A0A1X7V555_AMPQE